MHVRVNVKGVESKDWVCGRNEYVSVLVWWGGSGINGRKNRNVNMERGEVNAWELVWRKLDKYVEGSATGTANVKGVYIGDTVAVHPCM